MTRIASRLLILLVLGAVVGAALIDGLGALNGVLLLVPGLALFAVLLGDVYPGEELLERARARRAAARPRITAIRTLPPRPDAVLGHAPRPLARRPLAVRPPPLAA